MSYNPQNLKLTGTVGGASPLENSPELITGLGVIMARWATLDHTLQFFVYAILGDYRIAEAALYSQNPQSRRLEIIRDLIDAGSWNSANKRAGLMLIDELDALAAERNDLVHSKTFASSAFADAEFTADVVKAPARQGKDGGVEMEAFLAANPNFRAIFEKKRIRLAVDRKPTITLTKEFLQDHADRVAGINIRLMSLSMAVLAEQPGNAASAQ